MFSERNKERIKQIILPIKAKKNNDITKRNQKKLYERKKSKPTNYAIDKQREASEQEQEKTKLY